MVKMDMTPLGRFKADMRSAMKDIKFEHVKVHIMLLSIQLIFSVFYVLAKVALKNIPPFLFLTLRLIIATPLLWILAAVTSREQIIKLPTKKEWMILAVSGIFAVTINQSLFLVGLSLSTASNAALTQPAIPIFSTLFAVVLGYEKKTALKFIGIGVAVIGAILMIDFTHLKSDSQSSRDIVLGNLCFLGNTIAYAIFLLSQRPLLKNGMSPAKSMAWSFLIGTPIVVIIAFATTKDIGQAFNNINLFSWLVILYTATFATAYTFWASSVAIKKTDPTTVAVYLTIEPLATSIMARIFLAERLTALNIVGAFIILFGVAVVMFSKHKEKKIQEMDDFEKIKNAAEHEGVPEYTNQLSLDLILASTEEKLSINRIDNSNNIQISPDNSNKINEGEYEGEYEDDEIQINEDESEDGSLFLKNSGNKMKK